MLIVSQYGTSWSLPKGHIEAGEDLICAARREIFEETGISNLELIKELGCYERYKIGINGREDRSELKTITVFLFKTGQEDLNPRDEDNPIARWIDRNSVSDLLTHKKDREFFESIVWENLFL